MRAHRSYFRSYPKFTSYSQRAVFAEMVTNVHVESTDVGSSEKFLGWMELGQTSKTYKKRKHLIKLPFNRFGDDKMKSHYQNALKDELHGFSEY